MLEAKIKALAPWFGSNRVLAANAGRELARLRWCGVPFCGGCPELPYIDTAAGVACDKHLHIINLARVVRSERGLVALTRDLEGRLFHPEELRRAQAYCVQIESSMRGDLFCAAKKASTDENGDAEWAAAYFISAWMGRGAHAGKQTEFTQGLALRYTSSGGDSARRLQSAIESLQAWHRSLRVWSFDTCDAFDLLDRVQDAPGHGLYVDAPWPELGDEYRHRFTDHKRLAQTLGTFRNVRIVVRYGDHPIIRELYPRDRWTWVEQITRNQQNNAVSEVLIINGPSYGKAGDGT